jgi:hypothetical protein
LILPGKRKDLLEIAAGCGHIVKALEGCRQRFANEIDANQLAIIKSRRRQNIQATSLLPGQFPSTGFFRRRLDGIYNARLFHFF